jgi:hypothetical protein
LKLKKKVIKESGHQEKQLFTAFLGDAEIIMGEPFF